jgi:hypothetical protein
MLCSFTKELRRKLDENGWVEEHSSQMWIDMVLKSYLRGEATVALLGEFKFHLQHVCNVCQ